MTSEPGPLASIHELSAFSLLPYPAFNTHRFDVSQQLTILRDWVLSLKRGEALTLDGANIPAIGFTVKCLARLAPHLRRFLGPDRQLIPIPPSASWSLKDSPMHQLCQKLHSARLGRSANLALKRTVDVQTAHLAGEGKRPSVETHIRSLEVVSSLIDSDRPITLMDDILTSGTTAMACYQVLARAGFRKQVALLTIGHTVNTRIDVRKGASCFSTIKWAPNWPSAHRPPSTIQFVNLGASFQG